MKQKDKVKIINEIKRIREIGNNVIDDENDTEKMENEENIKDKGTEAGTNGGEII